MKIVDSIVGSAIAIIMLSTQVMAQELPGLKPAVILECVDSPPFGDGYGWNGRCGCDMEPGWSDFGRYVALDNNIAAVSVHDTPENCPDTGEAVSIFEKSNSGVWQQTADFYPTVADYEYIERLRFINNVLVVDIDDGISHSLRAFKRQDTGEWTQLPLWNDFGSLDARIEGGTVVVYERDLTGSETAVWASDGSTYFGGTVLHQEKGLAVWRFSSHITIVSESISGGEWFDTQVPISGPIQSVMVDNSLIVMDQYKNFHVVERDDTGNWITTSQHFTDLPDEPLRGTRELPLALESENRLLVAAPGHLRTYNTDWIEQDRFEVPDTSWAYQPYGDGPIANIAMDAENLLVGDRDNGIVYTLNVSPDGIMSAPSVAANNSGSCDYSDAALYDGWGRNSVTQTPCAPIESPADDTNASGTADSSASGTVADTSDATNAIESSGNMRENNESDVGGDEAEDSNSVNSEASEIIDSAATTTGGGGSTSITLLLILLMIGSLLIDKKRHQ